MAKIIGITGGKGGTGKSTVSTALAYELSKDNKVLLIDADADCPNDHLILGIKTKRIDTVFQRVPKWDEDKCIKCGMCGKVCRANAIVAIKGKSPFFMPKQCNGCGACYIICKAQAISWDEKEAGYIHYGSKDNIDLISGELKINEPVAELVVNYLNKIIEEKKKDYDYIIIDTAAGIKCDVISALEKCGEVFAVTEPTPLGKHDLELVLKLLSSLKKKAKIILNRADVGNKEMIKELAKEYGLEITTQIPYKKEMLERYSKGKPIEEKSIEEIKNRILESK